MTKRTLTYNGVNLTPTGVYVDGSQAWNKPAPDFEHVSVPGRSGEVLLFNNRFTNVDITYTFGIKENFDTNYNAIIVALLNDPGYHKLVDSLYPDYYWEAAVETVIEPDMGFLHKKGSFAVTFTCKPFRKLTSGEVKTQFTSTSMYITNPTLWDAYPLVQIKGYGSFSIRCYNPTTRSSTTRYYYVRDYSSVTSNAMVIDFETGRATDYYGLTELTDYLTWKTSSYTVSFKPLLGSCNVYMDSKSSTITEFYITPRWQTL